MTSEQIEKIKEYEVKMNHGYTVNGGEVTRFYNEVLNKNLAPTNCGSCIRRRIQELVTAMHQYLNELAKQEEQKVEDATAVIEPEPEQEEPKPKRTRKAKK